jgi:hypothetical protein
VQFALLLIVAATIRLLLFTGLALGDDVFYTSAAAALSDGQGWPPPPHHWQTRLGITLPTAAALAAFGWHPFVFVWLPFFASLCGVWLCYRIVESVAGTRAAWIAAILQSIFPLEVIFSTHLFPDVIVGNLSALAVWLWVRGLQQDSTRAFLGAGAALAAGYLCRESVILEGPVYLALWIWSRYGIRLRVLWFAVLPVLTVLLETALHAASTGDPFYRWRAIATQQTDPLNMTLFQSATSGGTFWTDPLLMLVTSQEFGVFHLLSLPLAVVALWRRSDLRWVALWLLVGLGWLYYGTTLPWSWVPMHRDPRYAAAFTIPAVLLVAAWLAEWPPVRRAAAIAVLIVVSLGAASLDQRGTLLSPHRAFAASDLAPEATLEPFEYYGSRWVRGLRTIVPFACANDTGRRTVVESMRMLPASAIGPARSRPYYVYSPERRKDLAARMEAEGWQPMTEFVGTIPVGRRLLAAMLSRVPSQRERAARIASPPRLVVLRNPR